MRTTILLRDENEVIERVARALEGAARGPMPALVLEGALEFLWKFVEGLHRAKVEEGLLPALGALGLAAGGENTTAVRRERARDRALLDELRAAAARAHRGGRLGPDVAATLREYADRLHRSIAAEAELFRVAERLLTPADDVRLAGLFAAVEAREGGERVRRAMLELADALARAADVSPHQPRPPRVAADVMRRNVPRARPADSLAHAAERMESFDVRELPVVERGSLVGILARRDLLPHRGHYEWTAVGTAMTPDPVTVAPETTIDSVVRLLLARGFNSVPVAIGHTLVGMAARTDFLRLLVGDS